MVLLLVLVMVLLTRAQYPECQRGLCSLRTDRDTGWLFDQPQQEFLDPGLRAAMEVNRGENVK